MADQSLNPRSTYTVEERLNALSHAIGIIFGVAGLFLLLKKSDGNGEYDTFSLVLYSICFIVLFAASTLYHTVSRPLTKARMRIMDHIGIFLLIAGTYTPVCLITLKTGNGWLIFWLVWAVALIGSVLKIFFTGKFEKLSLILYLVMGWLIVFDIGNLVSELSELGLTLLVAGGISYSLGTIFYIMRFVPFHHLIWHIFVLGGAVCHWFMIYLAIA